MSLIGDIGSIVGAFQANDAQQKQTRLEQQSYALQQALAQQQIKLSQDAARQGVATTVDAEGNTQAYDPVSNTWKVTLTPNQQRLQQGSDAEQQAQYGDLKESRLERVMNANRRSQEGQTADALLRQTNDAVAGRGAVTPDSVASAGRLAQAVATARQGAQVGNDVATSALRSGTTPALIAAMQQRGIGSAPVVNTADAGATATAQNSDRLSAIAAPYNEFAARASNINDAAFSPSGVSSSLTDALSNNQTRGLQAQQIGTTGIGNAARGLAAAPMPNLTKGAGQLASGLGNLFDSEGSKLISALKTFGVGG